MAQICKSDVNQVRTNFNALELYSGSIDAPDCHYLSDNVLNAVQELREWSGMPIRILSTYRTELHNSSLKRASSNSQHLYGKAIDFQWVGSRNQDDFMKRIREALICSQTANPSDVSTLTAILFNNNIRGIGLYKTFIHLDDRGSSNDPDIEVSLPPMSIWDETNNKYDNYKLTSAWWAQSIASGMSGFCGNPTVPPKSKKKSTLTNLLRAIRGEEEFEQDGIGIYGQDFLWWIIIVVALILAYITFK